MQRRTRHVPAGPRLRTPAAHHDDDTPCLSAGGVVIKTYRGISTLWRASSAIRRMAFPAKIYGYRPSRIRMTCATALWSQSFTMQAPAARTSGAQLAGAKPIAAAFSMEISF